MEDPRRYKVVRLLDDLMPLAVTPQKSGVSFDVRLYFREDPHDGHLWGEVALIDRDTGKLINTPETALPLACPEDFSQYLRYIVDRGFSMAIEMKTG